MCLGLQVAFAVWAVSTELCAAAPTTRDEPARAEPPTVMIVWIGESEALELVELLRELLTRQGAVVRFAREPALSSDRVLGGTFEADSRVWVFVDVRESELASLYFRGPTGERFLVRELALPRGLDAVGREQVAQVVESSVTALLQTDAGMSREQARSSMAERERRLQPARTSEEVSSAPSPAPSTSPSAALIAARFGQAWLGPEFGALRSLGAELGVGWGEVPRLGLRLVLERGFPCTLDTEPLGAELSMNGGWLSADVGTRLGTTQRVTLGLGLGAEVTRIRPTAPRDAAVTVASVRTNWVPAARIEARYQVGIEPMAMGLGVFALVPVVDTHYDIERDGGVERVAEPWGIIPGVALMVGWEPTNG